MTHINWSPSPAELRRWALVLGPSLGVAGALFRFVPWGIFAGGGDFAKILWGFGAFAFVTGLTGGKAGLPAYWLWMSFVFVVSWVITQVCLAVVFLFVVTPLAIAGRLAGRDRLQLRKVAGRSSYWCDLDGRPHDPERQF